MLLATCGQRTVTSILATSPRKLSEFVAVEFPNIFPSLPQTHYSTSRSTYYTGRPPKSHLLDGDARNQKSQGRFVTATIPTQLPTAACEPDGSVGKRGNSPTGGGKSTENANTHLRLTFAGPSLQVSRSLLPPEIAAQVFVVAYLPRVRKDVDPDHRGKRYHLQLIATRARPVTESQELGGRNDVAHFRAGL